MEGVCSKGMLVTKTKKFASFCCIMVAIGFGVAHAQFSPGGGCDLIDKTFQIVNAQLNACYAAGGNCEQLEIIWNNLNCLVEECWGAIGACAAQ